MRIKINGKDDDINGDKISISEILIISNVERPDIVSVQLNGEFVKKEVYQTTYLKEGDEIEFLYFMGGGSF